MTRCGPLLYAPELEDWNSASPELSAEECGALVTLSGTLSLRPFSWRGWKTRPWIARLSGAISNPSRARHYAAAWISLLRASRASPSLWRALAGASRTSATSGLGSLASFATWDRGSSCWKTSRGSSLFPGEPSFETYSQPFTHSGSMRNGACFARQPLEHRTGAKDSSWSRGDGWPTPTAGDAGGSGAAGYSTESGRHSGTTLTDAVVGPRGRRDLATPPAGSDGSPRAVLNPQFVETLMGYPVGWTDPTRSLSEPTASDASGTPLSRSRPRPR